VAQVSSLNASSGLEARGVAPGDPGGGDVRLREWTSPAVFSAALERRIPAYNCLHSALGYRPPEIFEADAS
jgi:hypothetical protein